jgi:CheY-like chemotaxis protein
MFLRIRSLLTNPIFFEEERVMGQRILLVEDAPAVRKTVGRMLESMGFDVVAVGCTDDAVEALDLVQFEKIVLDLGLPEKSCEKCPVDEIGGLKVIQVISGREGKGKPTVYFHSDKFPPMEKEITSYSQNMGVEVGYCFPKPSRRGIFQEKLVA